ncbi:MAG: PorV/PorQ family protein, partial [bacterium]
MRLKSIIGWLVFSVTLFTLKTSAQGTSGFEILRLQIYPRGSSLAGAVIADAGNIESIFYNPAGLGIIHQKTATAGYMNYLLGIQSGYLAYAAPLPILGIWGTSISYTNYGTFDGRSATGEELSDFSANDLVFGLSYANVVGSRLAIGASAKFAHSSIENYTGSALAFDLGAQYTFIPQRLIVGAGIFNLGWTTKAYVNHRDHLPLYYRIGVFGEPEGLPANLYFTMTLHQDKADQYSLASNSENELTNIFEEIYY